ncbi:hypothetical protein ACJMK2_028340 [Sinanodonta woodiana]|uniref:Uncharacterized protein n=1 Tax=Sinanodonta woodiana TaxID=1069815 RepID=A0ABD3X916_SINWO
MGGSQILSITLLFVLDGLFAQDRKVLATSIVRITGKIEHEATQNGYLKCEVTEPAVGTDYSLKWYNPTGQFIPFQGEINSSERLYASRESMFSVSLNFMPVRELDAGQYTCTAMINGQHHNGTFKITIFTDITFSNCPLEQKIISGNNQATLSCSASAGSIDLTTFWKKRDQSYQIQENVNKYAITKAGLIIFNISKTDEAIYEFHAKYDQTFSWKSQSINVKVMIKPEIVYAPTLTRAQAGDQFSMFCNASGDPVPMYFWYKEGTTNQWLLLMDSDRMVINKRKGELFIKSVRKYDEGQYKCQASNEAGFAEAQARLQVQVLPEIFEMLNGSGEENGEASISCRASGDPIPEIKWKPIDSDIFYPEGQSGDITVARTKNEANQESTALLKFEKLKPSQMGDYVCQAHNSEGYDTRYGHLSVRYVAKFNNQPRGPFYNWYGNDKGNVTCVMNGNPLPVVLWFKGGNQITGQTSYARITNIEEKDKFQVTSILFAKLELSSEQQILGDYICQGLNTIGTNSITIQMVQAEKPPAPGVSVDYYHAHTIRLAINVSSVQGPPVTKFNIRYKVQGSNDNPMTAEATVDWINYVDGQPVPRTYITLKNLAVKTQYIITVRAVNDVGESAPFEFTQSTRPYSVLQQLEITSLPDSPNATSFLLMWKKPVGESDIQILKYILGYRKVEIIPNKTQYELSKPLGEFIYVNDIPSTAVTYLLSSLTPGTYYQVEVKTVYTQVQFTLQSYIFKTKEDTSVTNGSPLLSIASTIVTTTITALITCLQVFM